jgi:Putative Actinobacterial Holin-X, holin superfamily III
MPTRADGGMQAAVHDVAEHARTLARLEAELAGLEVRRKVAALSGGAALLAAGAVLGLFALGFLLATAASALGNVVPMWLALLIVGGSVALVAAIAAAAGLSAIRRGVPPVPEQAIAEAKLTGEALRGRNGA